MKKALLLTWWFLSASQLLGQQRIECLLQPSFDASAVIYLQPTRDDSLLLIFKQPGKKVQSDAHGLWTDDTTQMTHIRRMGRYFQQFAFSDTVRLSTQEFPLLFDAYRNLLRQMKTLAANRDERILTDGLVSQLTIFNNSSALYRLTYRTPAERKSQLVDQFMKNLLIGLKAKSNNPATVNYCMIANSYMR